MNPHERIGQGSNEGPRKAPLYRDLPGANDFRGITRRMEMEGVLRIAPKAQITFIPLDGKLITIRPPRQKTK